MSLKEDSVFLDQLNQSTSVYAMVLGVAQKARKLAEDSGNALTHKEALTYAARGIEVDMDQFSEINAFERNYIHEQFCYIDDPDIKASVLESFKKSKKSKSLRFVYMNITGKSKMARVRVLTRMLFYKLLK